MKQIFITAVSLILAFPLLSSAKGRPAPKTPFKPKVYVPHQNSVGTSAFKGIKLNPEFVRDSSNYNQVNQVLSTPAKRAVNKHMTFKNNPTLREVIENAPSFNLSLAQKGVPKQKATSITNAIVAAARESSNWPVTAQNKVIEVMGKIANDPKKHSEQTKIIERECVL